jgi:hypothetical protein
LQWFAVSTDSYHQILTNGGVAYEEPLNRKLLLDGFDGANCGRSRKRQERRQVIGKKSWMMTMGYCLSIWFRMRYVGLKLCDNSETQ